jgi:hypothetical protein
MRRPIDAPTRERSAEAHQSPLRVVVDDYDLDSVGGIALCAAPTTTTSISASASASASTTAKSPSSHAIECIVPTPLSLPASILVRDASYSPRIISSMDRNVSPFHSHTCTPLREISIHKPTAVVTPHLSAQPDATVTYSTWPTDFIDHIRSQVATADGTQYSSFTSDALQIRRSNSANSHRTLLVVLLALVTFVGILAVTELVALTYEFVIAPSDTAISTVLVNSLLRLVQWISYSLRLVEFGIVTISPVLVILLIVYFVLRVVWKRRRSMARHDLEMGHNTRTIEV